MVNGKTLLKGSDYTVGYTNNIMAGTATITVTGIGNYEGTAKITFEIVNKTTLTIGGIEDQEHEYTGSPVVLDGTLTVTGGPDTITAEDLTETFNVTVYGLSKISITTSVDGGNGIVTPSMTGVLEGTKMAIESPRMRDTSSLKSS